MKTFSGTINERTEGNSQLIDITKPAQDLVRQSTVETGQMTAMVVGSTAGLSTVEFEPGLVNHDIEAAMERIAPQNGRYLHEETWHDDNGHSHVRATLIGPSLCLPIVGGTLPLGTWQQIVLIDFDTRPRDRQIVVAIIGE